MYREQDQESRFDGSTGLGLVSVLVLGPLVVIGAVCVVVGFLAMWGIEVGPWRDANVPVLVDLLYGGGAGAFRSFLFFMGGAVIAMLAWTGIVWCFTGKTPS